jgi:hypothetical protein
VIRNFDPAAEEALVLCTAGGWLADHVRHAAAVMDAARRVHARCKQSLEYDFRSESEVRTRY